MPLFYQKDINHLSKLAIWHLVEEEVFFADIVPIKKDITHPHKRLQHLGGRYLLPFLYPDFPYDAIEIADTKKPFLPEEQYHFSISHCGDFAAAIVSSREQVGIDIEIITERVHKIKQKFLHVDELAFVNNYQAEEHTKLLTLLWSAKEAMFKCWGRGDISFSQVLRIAPFKMMPSGIMQAAFQKPDMLFPLQLHYQIWDEMVLVWVVTEPIVR